MPNKQKQDVLTEWDFFRFFQCPHWPYYERFGRRKDRARLTQEREELLSGRLMTERVIVKKVYGSVKEVKSHDPQKGWRATEKLMLAGAPVIYRGWLSSEDRLGRPTILERVKGKSRWGSHSYRPVVVKRRHTLRKEDSCQLAFYAELLEKIQGVLPAEAAVLSPDAERLSFSVGDFLTEYQAILAPIQDIRRGRIPDPIFRKSCSDTSPWGHLCKEKAEQDQDVALLFSVDHKKLQALRQLGMTRVEHVAEMDPLQYEGQSPVLSAKTLQLIQKQARSLMDQSIIVRKPFVDHGASFEVHFDIESYPQTDTDYLFGFFIRDRRTGKKESISFFADKVKDEKRLWKSFVSWLSTLPETYTVYHYAAYEAERIQVLAKRYGDTGHPDIERFLGSMKDLKEIARDHLVFPLYFYSLKLIGGLIGYHWTGELTNGGKSIDVYDRWLKKGSVRDRNSLIRYNQHDVYATAALIDWLRTYATKETVYLPPYPWLP